MAKLSYETLPEAFVSDARITRAVSDAAQKGQLRKLASKLYTTNLTDPPDQIVRRNLWALVSQYFPDGLVADRTALESMPAEDGSVFLISSKRRAIELPGIALRPRQGPPPLPSDRQFVGTLRLSSPARAYLENLRPSRARGGLVPRTLPRREIEERLENLLRRRGEQALNRLRDEAREIASELRLAKEGSELDRLIGSLLGSRDAELEAPVAVARKAGRPYDPDRLELFMTLFASLRQVPPVTRLAEVLSPEAGSTLAFYEAYFSNFIEGTEFDVDEAADIVFRGKIPEARPADAHDVLATYRVASSADEMRRLPNSSEDLIRLLKSRHATIMAMRPDRRPGEFKIEPNRAGSTWFVKPDLVVGTVEKAFEVYRTLEAPFQRAVFVKFLVSEIHPFADGNGRVARLMMNAELVAAGEQRIIIPTVYRNNYLAALRALSHSGHGEALIRTMDFAQRYTAAIPWESYEQARQVLDATHAFLDPGIADESGLRLRMPRPENVDSGL